MLSLLSWIIVGALAGWIASMIMKTDAQMGALANIVAGIVGGWVVGLFGVQVADGAFNVASILTAILGACIVIAIVKAMSGRQYKPDSH